jgi:hypothetical protein
MCVMARRLLATSPMSVPRTLCCCRTVPYPLDGVAEALRNDPIRLLQRATTSAALRTASPTATMHADVVGLDVKVNVRLLLRRIRERSNDAGRVSDICTELAWEAIRKPALFPSILAELRARFRSDQETQLELEGSYWVPLGSFGAALDAFVGRRIAKRSLENFLQEFAAQLGREFNALPLARSATGT